MFFNGFTALCCVIAALPFIIWVIVLHRRCKILGQNYETAMEIGADMLAELKELRANTVPGTCCNCGNDDGPYPVCLDCLMKITGVAPAEMSLSEIVTELDRVVPELPPQRSAEWDRLMRGAYGVRQEALDAATEALRNGYIADVKDILVGMGKTKVIDIHTDAEVEEFLGKLKAATHG